MSGLFSSDKSEYQKRKANGSVKVTDEDEPEEKEEEEKEEETVDVAANQDAYVKDNLDLGTHFAVLYLVGWNNSDDEDGVPDAAFFDRLYATHRLVPLTYVPYSDDIGPCLVFRKEA